jgi:hypothetical protein
MGWTSYHATNYKNGKVDRKAECDAYFMDGLNSGYFKIEKSAMVGSVYYAAVRGLAEYVKDETTGEYVKKDIPESEQRVFGVVILTHIDNNDWFNFSYKEMTEDCGPRESKCPASIIKILSNTDSEYAIAWRKRCIENAKKKTEYPIGTIIEFENWNGEVVKLVKCAPAYQFKTAWWKYTDKNMYFAKKHIPWDKVRKVG